MERNKSGFLALIGLVAVASLFTVCKASGVGSGSDDGNAPASPIITWTVTFDLDDGTEPFPVTVFDGDTLGGTGKFPAEPDRDSFTFDGWWTEQNGEGTPFIAETVVREDIFLYALWTPDPVYDYADESNNGWTELANFITDHQGAGNSAATPASIRIINVGTVDAAAMAAVSTQVTEAGYYVFLDLRGAGNSFTNPVSMNSIINSGQTFVKGIALPEGVTAMAGGACYAGAHLTSVTLPASLETIGDSAFNGCTGLTGIDLPTNLSSIGQSAFAYSGLTSVTLPANLSSIGPAVFQLCTSLAVADLSECTNLSSIGPSAFQSCTSLASVTLPANLSSIGGSAFTYCTSLAEIDLPASLSTLGQAFVGCTSLARVTFNSSIGESGISGGAFDGGLREKYLAEGGGTGTYTRELPAGEWTKQE